MFRSFLLFSILLIVHELGHFLMGYFWGWKLDKIVFYPYGGCTYFNTQVNVPLYQELLVLIMGPLFQIIFYFLLSSFFIYGQDLVFLKSYHYGILFFNLLPIYPLDGGRLMALFFAFFLPYRKSLSITFFLSYLILFGYFFFAFVPLNLSLFFMGMLLLSKLFIEQRKSTFYYHRFLMERYLNPFFYKRHKTISKIDDMYRGRLHLFKKNATYYTEKTFLKQYFNRK